MNGVTLPRDGKDVGGDHKQEQANRGWGGQELAGNLCVDGCMDSPSPHCVFPDPLAQCGSNS